MVMKKPYDKPACRVEKIEFRTQLLSGSSSGPDDSECGDNPWWCDRQPSPDDWWGH